jgi:hypothetical protein
MEITFTRTGQRTYTTVVVRDDGVTIAVPSFDRPAWLPHDLAHYVVEHALGLTQGFWGCVAAGAVFPGMTVVSGRQPPHAAARSQAIMREMGQHGTEAEVLVGILVGIVQDGLDPRGPAAHARVSDAWQDPRYVAREPLHAEKVYQVCMALREAQQQWQALAIGQSITVTWAHHRARKRSTAHSM